MSSTSGNGRTPDPSEDLLRRCRRGEATALSRLVSIHRDRLYRLALRMLRDPSLAEEATARTFVAIWTRAGQWRGDAAAGTWIHRIALRKILDVSRSERRWRRRFAARLAGLVDPRPCPAGQAERREREEMRSGSIQAALACLTEEDRALVHLFYFESLSLAQIEAILGVPRANLKMRLARARGKLRVLLGGEHGSDP